MKFFFNVRNGDELAPDESCGLELPTLEHARDEATLAARQILAERIRFGLPVGASKIEIANEAGDVLLNVPLEVAVVR